LSSESSSDHMCDCVRELCCPSCLSWILAVLAILNFRLNSFSGFQYPVFARHHVVCQLAVKCCPARVRCGRGRWNAVPQRCESIAVNVQSAFDLLWFIR
jgi:hypothetical protein